MSEPKSFQKRVLNWFESNGRKNLPWQQNPTPYRVWVSEIMLQQTQVATVIPYFEAFMQRFPDLASLARSEIDDVLAHWSGLGYYARARNLHKAATVVLSEHHGELPTDLDGLVALPGIGRSTAGAILSLAHKLPVPILDGNVKRVLARHAAIKGWPGKTTVLNDLWSLSESLTPIKDTHKFNQAMMDLGATLCTRTRPQCLICPLTDDCQGRIDGDPTAYPGKKPRKSIPVRTTLMLCLRNDAGDLLLYKRPPAGVWGGLWSLPEVSSRVDIDPWLADHGYRPDRDGERGGDSGQPCRGKKISNGSEIARFRHTFSHFHLDITVRELHLKRNEGVIMEANGHVWYKWGTLPGGVAAPVTKILNLVGETS